MHPVQPRDLEPPAAASQADWSAPGHRGRLTTVEPDPRPLTDPLRAAGLVLSVIAVACSVTALVLIYAGA